MAENYLGPGSVQRIQVIHPHGLRVGRRRRRHPGYGRVRRVSQLLGRRHSANSKEESGILLLKFCHLPDDAFSHRLCVYIAIIICSLCHSSLARSLENSADASIS